MAGDPDAALQIVDGIPRHLNLDRRGHDVLPEGFLQPGEQPIGGLAAVGAEEVDGHDLGLPGLEAREPGPRLGALLRRGFAAQPRGDAACLLGKCVIVLVARRAEHGAHLLVLQAVDEPRLADHRLAAAIGDLVREPGEILLRLLAGRQRVDRVLDRDRTDALQAAPHLDAQIGRLGRDLVDQQQPAIRRCGGAGVELAHGCIIRVALRYCNTCIF